MADQHLLFVSSCTGGEAGGITAFNLDTGEGSLEKINWHGDIDAPFYLALSPNRKYLYATSGPGESGQTGDFIAAYEIGSGGDLKRLNEQPTEGRTACYVDVDPTGQALVMANYSSGSIGSYPINGDGSLGEMVSFYQHEGASMVNEARQEGPHAHCSVISPGGRHMFACDLGLDQILGYELDASTARLTPLNQPYVRTLGGGGPRHFSFHPTAGYAYANNELHNSVNAYRYDTDTGLLIEQHVISTLPEDFDGDNYTADMKITPDGRFLYCSNRLHDSIAIFSIGGDGRLTLVDTRPSLGNFAQNLAITPDGGILLCANMHNKDSEPGANVVVFRIDKNTGKLEAAGDPVDVARPSCIMIV